MRQSRGGRQDQTAKSTFLLAVNGLQLDKVGSAAMQLDKIPQPAKPAARGHLRHHNAAYCVSGTSRAVQQLVCHYCQVLLLTCMPLAP
jgi:hypothetical protein